MDIIINVIPICDPVSVILIIKEIIIINIEIILKINFLFAKIVWEQHIVKKIRITSLNWLITLNVSNFGNINKFNFIKKKINERKKIWISLKLQSYLIFSKIKFDLLLK